MPVPAVGEQVELHMRSDPAQKRNLGQVTEKSVAVIDLT